MKTLSAGSAKQSAIPSRVTYFNAKNYPGWFETFGDISHHMMHPMTIFLAICLCTKAGVKEGDVQVANVLMIIISVTGLLATALGATIILLTERAVCAAHNQALRESLESLERGEPAAVDDLAGIIRYCREHHPEKPWAELIAAARDRKQSPHPVEELREAA